LASVFNPAGDENVAKAKQLAADLFDLVEQSVTSRAEDNTNESARKRKMRDAALQQIITAQMWAVKVLTLDK
jgi:hypothetical protein